MPNSYQRSSTFIEMAVRFVEVSLGTLDEHGLDRLRSTYAAWPEEMTLSELATEIVDLKLLEAGEDRSIEYRCSDAFLGEVLDKLAACHLHARHPDWAVQRRSEPEPKETGA